MSTVSTADTKIRCADCNSDDVEISLPAWFTANGLNYVECDAGAEELSTYCNNCGDCTELVAPNGKAIRGRWQ